LTQIHDDFVRLTDGLKRTERKERLRGFDVTTLMGIGCDNQKESHTAGVKQAMTVSAGPNTT